MKRPGLIGPGSCSLTIALIVAHFAYSTSLLGATLTPSSIEVGDGHAVVQILVEENGPWTVTDDVPWLSVSSSDGTGVQNLLLTIERNLTASDRTDSIEIGGATCTVTQRVEGSGLKELWAMGSAINGKLGDNSIIYRVTPVAVMEEGESVAAGSSHSLFIKSGGALFAAGFNIAGQIGDGTVADRSGAVQVASDVAMVAAGEFSTLFVRTDGTLWAMGSNGSGQLGDQNPFDGSVPYQIQTDVRTVATGAFHTLVLKTDGTLWTMGDNMFGQLGDGTTTSRANPVMISADVTAIATGEYNSFFVKTDGSLWAMGSNGEGQLGDGSTTDRSTPVNVAAGVATVSAGYHHALFVKTNGTLWAIGGNYNGQLGDGSTNNTHVPVIIASSVRTASAGHFHSLFLKTDGTLWAMGSNQHGQLGEGSTTNRSTPVQIASSVVSASAGAEHSIFVLEDGSVYSTGSNSNGQLADGTRIFQDTPVHVASNVKAVAAGTEHTLFAKSDGTLWVMGSNSANQLGDGTVKDRTSPVQIGTDVEHVAAGAYHSLFLKSDGTLWGFGQSGEGQLGGGVSNSYTVPTQVASGVEFVSAGAFHTLFIKTDKTLWAIGRNYQGALGDGSTTTRYSPVQIASDVSTVSAGYDFSFFVKEDGTLWAMGSNYYGQLGDGTTNSHATPVQIATGVKDVAAGHVNSLFVRTDGTLWAMGDNTRGQLGDGTNTPRSTPVQVASDVEAVWAKGHHNLFKPHSLFLKTDATLWGMGDNTEGELGIGNRLNQSTPVKIAKGVTAATAGGSHSLFIATGPFAIPPVITIQPAGDTVNFGLTASFTVLAKGSPPMSFQWFKDGVEIEGATEATHDIAATAASDAGTYHVVVSNPAGSLESDKAVLTVNTPPAITTGPSDQTVTAGQPATFSVGVTGAQPLSYQWRKDGVVVPGATTATYQIEVAHPSHEGAYSVVVTNFLGSATSEAALLKVNVPPSILTPPSAQVVIEGQPASFTITASGTAPLTYQWHKDGEDIVGAVGATLEIEATQPADAGNYAVTVSNVVGSAESGPASLTVNSPPKLSLQPASVSLLIESSAAFSGMKAIAVGGGHSLLLKADGTLWSTGSNNYGQLGDGSTSARTEFKKVASGVASVAAGGAHSLFIKTDGTLWGMGLNEYGQLGDGSAVSRSVPVKIASGVQSAAAGATHSLFVKTDGTLWGMGRNTSSCLGDGTNERRFNPVQVASDVVSVATSFWHTLFIKTDATMWAMGNNVYGQLGDGSDQVQALPVPVASDVVSVATGSNHSLFVKRNGTLWVMGSNFYGQLGDGTTVVRTLPIEVAQGVSSVSGGTNHSYFLSTDGTLWGMGDNSDGQLGDGTGDDRHSPVEISSAVAAIAVGPISNHGMFALEDGTLWAMGANETGALGDGTSTDRLTPVQVNDDVRIGPAAALTVTAIGTGALQYQWYRDGVGVPGAIDSSYYLSNVSDNVAGNYHVVVTNDFGMATSEVATISVAQTTSTPPVIMAQPIGGKVVLGKAFEMRVEVFGTTPTSFQWKKGGVPISGATGDTLSFPSTEASQAGNYSVVVSNAIGSVTSTDAALTIDMTPRLINVSCRAFAGAGDDTLVMGFYISGTGEKTLLIRGIGPTLGDYIEGEVVANPRIAVYHGNTVIEGVEDWDASLAPTFSQMGAFALTPGSADAAFTITLEPGSYTVHLVNDGPVAEGLIEVYDLSRDLGTRLTNVSCRLSMKPNQIVILGTALIGSEVSVLARGVGPGIATYLQNPADALADPHLRVYRGDGEVALNDDWELATRAWFVPTGAFDLPDASKDAALRVPFEPGGYTVHATGKGGDGIAIIELYESP